MDYARGMMSLYVMKFCVFGVLLFSGAPAMGYDDFELYQTYTFYVEEGILHQPRIIGNVSLISWNASNIFEFDETEFNLPYNRKAKAKPQHFDVKFLHHIPEPESTTADIRKFQKRDLIDETHNTSTSHTYGPTAAVQFEYSGEYGPSTTPPITAKAKGAKHIGNGSSWTVAPNTTTPFGAYGRNETTHNSGSGVTSQHETSATSMTKNTPSVSSFISTTSSTVQTSEMSPVATTEQKFSTWSPFLPSDDHYVGEIWQIYDLDREESDTHFITINSYLQDEIINLPTLIVVKVTDINDNSPVFVQESLTSEISKKTKTGEIVGKVRATDADAGQNAAIHYSLLDFSERKNNENASPDIPTFSIHGEYGVIFLMKSLDKFENSTKITFSVVAQDNAGKVPSNRATATVTVKIVDGTTEPTSSNPVGNIRTSAVVTVSSVESKSNSVSLKIVIPSIVGGLVMISVVVILIVRMRRKRQRTGDGTLAFMLDDGNPQYNFL